MATDVYATTPQDLVYQDLSHGIAVAFPHAANRSGGAGNPLAALRDACRKSPVKPVKEPCNTQRDLVTCAALSFEEAVGMLASEVAEADEAYVALQQVGNGYGYVRMLADCVERTRARAHTHTHTHSVCTKLAPALW